MLSLQLGEETRLQQRQPIGELDLRDIANGEDTLVTGAEGAPSGELEYVPDP